MGETWSMVGRACWGFSWSLSWCFRPGRGHAERCGARRGEVWGLVFYGRRGWNLVSSGVGIGFEAGDMLADG